MSKNPDKSILAALSKGIVELKGEFVWGSNYTFLVMINYQDQMIKAVYKPTQGEQPLWDFPAASLARREVAAYLISEALDWELVPPTVYREDGPYGPGSLQFYVDHDPEYHYFNFRAEDIQRLRPVVVFDLLINNADRKGSHVLFDAAGHLWLIDHGICFHADHKLRTVIWDFADQLIPENLLKDLKKLISKLNPGKNETCPLISELSLYISPVEIVELIKRAEAILRKKKFPHPDLNRRVHPWPPV
jgi:hypothetical protein